MNNYKEKLFKAITYTAALFTIIFLFGIIASIFYEGTPVITHDLGQLPLEAYHNNFGRPWHTVKKESSVRAYCEVLLDNEPATGQDEVAAFIDGECRGVAEVSENDGMALAVLDIQADRSEEGKIIKFAIFDESYGDVFTAMGVAVLDFSQDIGERDYPIFCESGSPYLHPRQWQIKEYDHATMITVTPTFDGEPAETGDQIGAFVDDECRGIGTVEMINGLPLAKFNIYGNIPETAVFSVYDKSEQTVLGVNKKLITVPGSNIGNSEEPVLLQANHYFGGDPQIFSRPWLPVEYTDAEITTVYCKLNINDVPAVEGSELGAFVNGECRGVARLVKKGKKALATIPVISYPNEIIQFSVYDASLDKVTGISLNTSTNPGGEAGNSPDIPYIIQFINKLISFIFGSSWHPTSTPGHFGILTLIVGSLLVTLGALIIAVPFGVGSAIYISEIASPRMREIIKPVIELLAGIPSVVYGLFGMAFLAPMLMKWFHLDAGLNILNASIILGIMVIPIISSMSEDALSMVPKNLRHASFGLGANRWETIIKVILPAAKTGVISSILLGFGRAIGETMVVIMVAGGSPQFPKSIFQSVRPMTSAIAAEMGETAHGTMHFHALYGIAAVLFIITFMTNLISELVFHRQKK